MILLWGLEDEVPLARVRSALQRLNAEPFFLDHRSIRDCHVEVEFLPTVKGRLETPDGVLLLQDVRAAYFRPYNFRQFPEFVSCEPGSSEWRHAASFDDVLWSWGEAADALVLNRPSAMMSNNSKPFQAHLIAACGFKTPETLIASTPESVRRFAGKHTAVIYKSISGTRSIVNRLTKERTKSLRDIAWCPTQFQEWVPGMDFRVHVIGDEIYSCAVESSADDYRYNSSSMRACALPRDVEGRCFRLSRQLELPLCGIDLRLTPAGEWYCFEVNPSPAYSCFEDATDTSMDSAIARLLIEADAESKKQVVVATAARSFSNPIN